MNFKPNKGSFKKGHKTNIGKKRSKEYKMNVSERMKGNKNGLGNRSRVGQKKSDQEIKKLLGRKMSKEAKKKMSIAHKGKSTKSWSLRGDKNYLWKGGITPENIKIRRSIEMRLWRESVFARDNWTCQKYNLKKINLHAHHIQNFSSFPELRFAIDNGITLSKKAHEEFHKMYGRKNNTREQLLEFINNKK